MVWLGGNPAKRSCGEDDFVAESKTREETCLAVLGVLFLLGLQPKKTGEVFTFS
jgi:hypothetical protein